MVSYLYYRNFREIFYLNNLILKASLDEKRLQEDLISGYNRLVRPVKHNSDKLIVKFGIRLIQILDVVCYIIFNYNF